MAMLENWRNTAYAKDMNTREGQMFWGNYFNLEKGIYEKLLEDGSYAYAFFNMGETSENVNTVFSEESNLRDVWAKEDLGVLDTLNFIMPKHTVRIIKSEKKATKFEVMI